MSQDPFAEASMNGAATGTATAERDGFTSAMDMDDPFGTSSDFRGEFKPSPPLESLQGRTVVMIPRSLDKNAKDPNDPSGQKTREVYTVDLTVLDGGPLTFFYTQKGDPEAQDPAKREDQLTEFTTEDLPATWDGYWVPQGGVIGKLKQAHGKGVIFLGVPTMVPVKADREKGMTQAQVQATVTKWIAAGKPGNRPRYTWSLENPTQAQKDLAVAWWKANRENIAPITHA